MKTDLYISEESYCSYPDAGIYQDAVKAPPRKENWAEFSDVLYSDSASNLLSARNWVIMMSRTSQAKDAFNQVVQVNSLIRGGVPVVAGTRVPVSAFIANLAADMSVSEIAEDLSLDRHALVSILQCLATVFDRPANEHDPARRMHKLEALDKLMQTGREDCSASIPKNIYGKKY